MLNIRKNNKSFKRNSVAIPFIKERISRRLIRKARDTDYIVELNKYAELGKLSTGLIHDILNPLTSLLIGLEAVHHSKMNNNPEILKEIQRASKRMREYSNLIHTYIKSEDNSKKSVSIRTVTKHVIELLAYKARSNGVSLIYVHKGKNILIETNPLWLYQIMINLISNAIESYENLIRENKRVNINSFSTKNSHCITIHDSGCGMSEETLMHIFDPFYSTKEKDSACGIGLVSVKHLIEKELKGSLSIKSLERKGTIFSIILPK